MSVVGGRDPNPVLEHKESGMKNPRVKKILLALLGLFLLIQFIRIDRSVPEYDAERDFVLITHAPPKMEQRIRSSCYDCHSYETRYPWYSQIAPVSWFLRKHIKEGREHLNFSTWGMKKHSAQLHLLEEAYEEVLEGEMPLRGYALMHGEAKMSQAEREELAAWFKQVYLSFGGDPASFGEEEEGGEHEHEEHEH